MILKLDLHVHTDRSPDGMDSFDDVVRAAKARGLDGIALTDHDLLSQGAEGELLLIPGCECSTSDGHILALFVRELPPVLRPVTGSLPSAAEAIRAIHALGGIAVWAHPFERRGAVPEDAAAMADLIESYNARACFRNSHANAMAGELAARLKKPKTGGSDAHGAEEVGNCFTEVDCKDRSLAAVREALLAGRTVPVHVRSTPRLRKGLSQLVKCRRAGASALRIGKAYAYIGYCVLLDAVKR